MAFLLTLLGNAFPRSFRSLAALVLATVFCLAGSWLQASTYSWDPDGTQVDDNGTWDLATSGWYNGSADVVWPNTGLSIASFGYGSGGTTALGVTLNQTTTVGGFVFQNQDYTLSGGSVSLAATSNTIAVNSQISEIESNIGGSGGLIETGTGILALGGQFSYSGTTQVNGRLDIDTGDLQGITSAGTVNTNSGGYIINSGGTLNVCYATPGTTRIYSLGTGSLTINTGGEFIAQRQNIPNALVLSGGSIWAGNGFGFNLSGAGKVNAAQMSVYGYPVNFSGKLSGGGGFSFTNYAPNYMGSGPGGAPSSTSSYLGGGCLEFTSTDSFTGNITVTGAGSPSDLMNSGQGGDGGLWIGGNNFASTPNAKGALGGTSGNYAGTITNNANIYYSASASQTLSGPIVGTGYVMVANTLGGNLTISNSTDIYSGGAYVQGGWLQIGANSVGSVGSINSGPLGTGTLVLNSGELSSNSTTARTILNPFSLLGGVTLGDPTNTGQLTFSAPGTVGSNAAVYSGSVVEFDGVLSDDPVNGPGVMNLQGGPGTTILANSANSFSGGTVITGGTVQIGASSVGSVGAITSGPLGLGTLTLDGGELSSNSTAARTILNAVAFTSGYFGGTGQVTLGDLTNTGTLAFNGSVTLADSGMNTDPASISVAAGVTAVFNGALSDDPIYGPGVLNLTGPGTLILTNSGNSYSDGTYVQGGTLIVTNSEAIPDGTNLYVGANVVSAFGTVDLAGVRGTTAAVPEPGTLALLAVGTLMLLFSRKRRTAATASN